MEQNERTNKINEFLNLKGKYFAEEHLANIKSSLYAASDDKLRDLDVFAVKDPLTGILLSVFLGGLGIDRFYAGDAGIGVGKLLTCGGCGIWWFIDLFLIGKRIKTKNFEKLKLFLA